MDGDDKALAFSAAYICIALIAYGFIVSKLGAAAMLIAIFMAALWPASVLVWLGAAFA